MAYTFTIEEKREYIRVEVFGERRPGKALEDIQLVWTRVTETMRAKKINKLLAILHLTGKASTVGGYNTVQTADDFGWMRNDRVALVATTEESYQINAFVETVAVNRGYQLKVFDNEPEAHDWLLGFNSLYPTVDDQPPVDLG
jgi:hypothetical protein